MASDNRNMDRDTQYRLSREKLKKRLDQDVDGRTEIEAADREEASKEAADRERADRERADRETQNTEMASKSEREAQTQKDRSLPESKHTQDVEKKNIIAPQTIKRVGQDQARRVRFAFDRERGLGWLLSMVGKNKWAILLYLLLGFLLSAFIYVRALPVRYDLKIGDVATLDITSNRDIVNKAETEVRAQNAKSQVQMITKRSETVSAEAVGRVKNFYAQVDSVRLALMNEAKGQNGTGGETVQSSTNSTAPSATDSAENKESTATTANSAQASGKTTESSAPEVFHYTAAQIEAAALLLQEKTRTDLKTEISQDDAKVLINLETSFYNSLKQQAESMAEIIMSEPLDQDKLTLEIARRVKMLTDSVTFYKAEYASIATVLGNFLRPNVVNDETATEQAREAAYTRIYDDPIVIPAGTRIVNLGDSITAERYQQLLDLNLIQKPGLDFALLIPIVLLEMLLVLLGALYLTLHHQSRHFGRKDRILIILTFFTTVIISSYTMKFSLFAIPIYLITIIIGMHFSLDLAVVVSIDAMLALLPLLISQTNAMIPLLVGVLCMALVTAEMSKLKNYAWLIIIAFAAPFSGTLLYQSLQQISLGTRGQNALIAGLCGGLSAVAAIGIQPLLELLTSSVSASQLIKLAQPSQPLLRRLFMEAPGTYQHSMMVANLAEKAAEVLEADSLLVRVGAYYHDLGKMEHPEVFTENQTDYNPHDYLLPQESVALIIGHVESGLKTARRHRLPLPIQSFIKEHHGNTLQASFYTKACEAAEAEGLPHPKETDYRYLWPIPGSRETGIVMLADSVEAAVRSNQVKDIANAELVIRKIVRIKNEQNQLVNSGLSYQDVERMIKSFVQVYQGQFHERVRYPDADPVSKQVRQIQATELQK